MCFYIKKNQDHIVDSMQDRKEKYKVFYYNDIVLFSEL